MSYSDGFSKGEQQLLSECKVSINIQRRNKPTGNKLVFNTGIECRQIAKQKLFEKKPLPRHNGKFVSELRKRTQHALKSVNNPPNMYQIRVYHADWV